ncbi:MAG: chromate transporter [Clostridium sp.]
MIYITLFLEFFKIGLFSVGGGLATLPFLYELADKYTWFEKDMLSTMIAVSESTPGPIGVNMATYSGYSSSGVMGAIVATLGLIVPSIIIIVIVAQFLDKFKESIYVDSAFSGLRPAVVGLIAAAGFQVLQISIVTWTSLTKVTVIGDIINIKATVFLIALIYATNKYKKHPIFYIGIAAVVGVVFKI